MKINQICIAGAGAIGGTLAARLATSGQRVNVLARGRTLAALREEGITLDDLEGRHHAMVNASDKAEELGPQDLILVCTKAPALATMLRQIQPLLHEQTIVIPVVNGMPWWYFQGIEGRFAGERIVAADPDGELARLLPAHHLIGAVVFITASREGPAHVRSGNPHLMIMGEINHQLSERLEAVRELIANAGIEARATDNIRDQLWTKIIANLTSNPLSVVTGATLEQLYSHPDLSPLVRQMLDEILQTAAAYGARIRFDPQTIMEMGTGMGAVRTSMLQDYDNHQPLELATIGDAVVELASRAGFAMPITRHVLALARFLASQRATNNTLNNH
ncbi:ketopantoate reductase family protein [Parathalassolituus penaei]|uniref:2-dehydropantoate 2-reductase n=1 Tax=Parathalassolituus penaei TaxID=2997323 RepID=A0A9X3EES6_9GAMM|nr:2-dehydropantoate 2-reductase [Parathalassolituus penaei]MCY0966257.1 2-dehydropantoate 2-reductase [Parathalassolituus penaei]